MSEELIKLLTDCHKVLSAMYFGGNPHKDLLDRIQSALAADQPDQPDQPDTRPGTPLMLTMETLDLWHQIIHDESLERGDRLQRIAARINVIQDSVKRAADQVKGGRVCPNTLKLCACEKYAPCADQVNADQPADAVVVPSDEELSALSLDSWERKYHKVRKEISLITWEEVYKRAYVEGFLAAQEGK